MKSRKILKKQSNIIIRVIRENIKLFPHMQRANSMDLDLITHFQRKAGFKVRGR